MKIKQFPVVLSSKKSYIQRIIDTNPIVYFPMNETSGTAAVNYGTLGSSANGTYSGVTLANASAPGGGLAPSFDGINDKLTATSAALTASLSKQEFTLMAWAKVLNAAVWTDGAYRSVMGFQVDNNNRAYFLKNVANNNFQFIYNGNSASTKIHDWTSYNYTEWMCIVHTISVSGNVMRSYINNVQFATPATTIAAWTGSPPMFIGANPQSGGNSFWKGWIAHVAIYNQALTNTEIATLYSRGL